MLLDENRDATQSLGLGDRTPLILKIAGHIPDNLRHCPDALSVRFAHLGDPLHEPLRNAGRGV
ncbi:MAG: hypothetical protein FJW34_18080 [Acidobacteria bacterium]|nr:hypothetical protein [Acidobacteriota bacterium]